MSIDELNTNHITADEGKVLRRMSDGHLFGREIYLGYTYYLNNEPLPKPLLELPEHFEEINDPEDEATVLLDEETPIIEEVTKVENIPLLAAPAAPAEKQRVTLADYKELERKVEMILKIIGEN